ncbi:uncharacterized protein RAG0_12676 [Rhynchosporium agropyri]|uniref:Uncharacterized protein n=1 Tax=Rhynchosporium agropyri TaxID=914238 RepID=A0A1E1L958_9HELO|nr:uncharacterized protein RAG0_12676 [Rhynchosporium agropyri]
MAPTQKDDKKDENPRLSVVEETRPINRELRFYLGWDGFWSRAPTDSETGMMRLSLANLGDFEPELFDQERKEMKAVRMRALILWRPAPSEDSQDDSPNLNQRVEDDSMDSDFVPEEESISLKNGEDDVCRIQGSISEDTDNYSIAVEGTDSSFGVQAQVQNPISNDELELESINDNNGKDEATKPSKTSKLQILKDEKSENKKE